MPAPTSTWASAPALRVAGQHADVYALWCESLAQAGDLVRRVRAEAAQHGRQVEFSISFRPILGETEDAAWAKADHILQETRGLLADAAKGDRVDDRLWTAIARETGGRSNTTSLVGTPEQVADALLAYYDLGITTFLIRSFDPLLDAIDYGRSLIPLTRELIARKRPAIAAAA